MGTRGRQSKNDIAMLKVAEVVATEYPGPPAGYSQKQRNKWLEIVSAYPAEHFPAGRLEVLDAFVRHAVELDHIGQLINQCLSDESFDLSLYEKLLKMQSNETRALASYSVRLGFAYSTAYEKRKSPETAKPWE